MPFLKINVGRTYERGKPLSEEFRRMIIDELEQKFSGNKENFNVARGAFAEVSRVFRVRKPTVSSIWKQYCLDKPETTGRPSRGRPRKLTNADIDHIEFVKLKNPQLHQTIFTPNFQDIRLQP